MKIRCIAIDDEPPALLQMEDYISQVPFLELVKTFDNAMDGIHFLKSEHIDLLFLDIEMEGFTGIQLLNVLKNKPKVILTTAYDNYAIQAFQLDVTDYLLKPISFERFIQSVEKVYDQFVLEQQCNVSPNHHNHEERQYIFVKTEYKMQRVDFKDILLIEGLKEYLIIRTTTGKVITLMSFKKMEDLLPSSKFIRIHKSYMVAKDKIDSIEKQHVKIGEKLIPIGDTYKKDFLKSLEISES